MEDTKFSQSDKDLNCLTEMVLNHLIIPRPGQSKHIITLQDKLIPEFMKMSRHAWLLASEVHLPTDDPFPKYFGKELEDQPENIRDLNNILGEMETHSLLQDICKSPELKTLASLPISPYEERLLNAAGYLLSGSVARDCLRHVLIDTSTLADTEATLERAAKASGKAHEMTSAYTTFGQHDKESKNSTLKENDTKKVSSLKWRAGLGKLFSGLLLLAGAGIMIPSLTAVPTVAIPFISTLASGIANVGEGAGQLLGEGD